MSVWFMHDNHTFTRLDTLPIDEAMDYLERLVDAEGGYGFVGTTYVAPPDMPPTILQWHPGEAWRARVRGLLLKRKDTICVSQT